MAEVYYGSTGGKTSDWVLIGLLAVGGYFAYKMIIKPASDLTNTGAGAVNTIVSDITKTGNNLFDLFNTELQTFQKALSKITFSAGSAGSTSPAAVSQVTAINPVIKVTPSTKQAYGRTFAFHEVTTAKGEIQSLAVVPNTYYPTAGIGFDTKGFGYSSAFPLSR